MASELNSYTRALNSLVDGPRSQFTDIWILIPFSILCYDHLLTLEGEINFVWRKPKRLSFFLFVALRYVSLLSHIGILVLRFIQVSPEVWIFSAFSKHVC